MKKHFSCLFFYCIACTYSFFAQPIEGPQKIDIKATEQKMKWGNYEGALDDYLSLLKKDPKNESYNYNVGVCYLNSNINKAKALPYFEIITRNPNCDPDAWYLLGRSYQFAYRFDDAMNVFAKYKVAGKGKPENIKDVDRHIQDCINAKERIKFPMDVTFENLGKNVNSQYADYDPFIPKDESYIVFNSKRPVGENEVRDDGTYQATIYHARVQNGVYSKAAVIGPPVTKGEGNEEVIGLSSAGDKMLLYYTKNGTGDIYMSLKNDKGFNKANLLDENVNSKGHEIAASVTGDGNAIYFASDRPGGHGGVDIYASRVLPNGSWGPAENLGPEINTALDEDFPNISTDGKTLYFSSKGHTSMGGYDIFKADWDNAVNKWGAVKNIGYPINTPDDNTNLRMAEGGRYGYISALREGGLGDYDIYRVTFNEIETEYTVINGHIDSYDPKIKVGYRDVFITATNINSQEIFGNYLPNPISGRYVMILSPGTYRLDIEATGFENITETITVLDKGSYETEVIKDILLKPKQK